MLVCSVSLRPPRLAIAADVAEITVAVDDLATGNIVFATLVDDPASVGEIVDAYLGEIMLEAASAADGFDVAFAYAAAVGETMTAADTVDAAISATLAPPLDGVANVTGAWSLSRDMLTAFASGTRYTKTGTAIITLEDQSGANRDFTDTGASARRPIEATAFPNSVLCADFNGTTNFLLTSAVSNFITASSGAVVVSVIIDAVSSNNAASYSNDGIIADNAVYMGLYARNLSGVTFYAYNWDGAEKAPSRTGAVGTAYVLMWRHHGGNIYVSVNGGTEVSVASGNTQVVTGLLVLGGNNTGSLCNCKIAEVFTTSDGSQTTALATAIANMKSYIGA